VTLRDPDGTVLGQGFGFWSPPEIWSDGTLAIAVEVMHEWVDPLGQASLSFGYALGDPDAATYAIRNGDHMYVIRQSRASLAFTSVAFTVDGLGGNPAACSGQAVDSSWINNYPTRRIYGYTTFVSQACTLTNVKDDYFLSEPQFYVSFEDPEGYSTASAPFDLTNGTWSGQVPLTGPEGPAGTLDATYTLTETGPTTTVTEEFPEYGYTQQVDITPASVHLVLSGATLSAELACTVEIWDIVQKWDNN